MKCLLFMAPRNQYFQHVIVGNFFNFLLYNGSFTDENQTLDKTHDSKVQKVFESKKLVRLAEKKEKGESLHVDPNLRKPFRFLSTQIEISFLTDFLVLFENLKIINANTIVIE